MDFCWHVTIPDAFPLQHEFFGCDQLNAQLRCNWQILMKYVQIYSHDGLGFVMGESMML
jgi:hypothetical protein